MFYKEWERTIYQYGDKKYDPLAIHRKLTEASGGKFNDLLRMWTAEKDGLGDVSPETRHQNAVISAQAEESLSKISRVAFDLPQFPECLDADALSYLRHFLEWIEGKDSQAGKPQ